MEQKELTQKDYWLAVEAQGAVNLSGVLLSFNEVMDRVRKECQGVTMYYAHHPICQLYATAVAHLTGIGHADLTVFTKAVTFCELKAGDTIPEEVSMTKAEWNDSNLDMARLEVAGVKYLLPSYHQRPQRLTRVTIKTVDTQPEAPVKSEP